MAKVLVVEDDPWSQRIVRDLLEMRGHQVVVASDVDEARGQLPDVPDVVLLDIHVPGGGGELLLREIRERGNSALPVIALTASAMRGDRERFLRQGFTAYVSKPIDFHQLASIIDARLARADRTELNHREIQALTWAARGATSADIARKLKLSKRTVDFHVTSARIKLHARTRTEAVIKAATSGLIKP